MDWNIILQHLGYFSAAISLLLLGRFVFQKSHRQIRIQSELLDQDNLAFSFSYVGYFAGLVLAIGSSIIGDSNGFLRDITDLISYGMLSIILLNIGAWINENLVLRSFSIRKEIIEDQNVGTGVIEGANYFATGLIVFGAISGEGINFFPDLINGYLLSGFITAIAFWLSGQLILWVFALLYNWITSYDIHKEIEKDNVAVGVAYAGVIIAIGNLIRYGVSGDFESWESHFSELGIDVLLGGLLIPATRLATDKILLHGASLTDELVNQEKPNVGAGLIEAFAYIAGSIVVTWLI